MKVWEVCNNLKGGTSTKKQIASWSYMNRICPIDFNADTLELSEKQIFPEQINEIANGICKESKCNMDCLESFLESEVPHDTKI